MTLICKNIFLFLFAAKLYISFFFFFFQLIHVSNVCLPGGHGGAVAGVFVEAARVWAAEAPRPSAETGVRGDCTSVWVLFPNVSMLCPADGVLFVCAAASGRIFCNVILASSSLGQESFFWVKPSVALGLKIWSIINAWFDLSRINFSASVLLKCFVYQFCDVYSKKFVLIRF